MVFTKIQLRVLGGFGKQILNKCVVVISRYVNYISMKLCTAVDTMILETFSIRFFMGNHKLQNAVCRYAFEVSRCWDFTF